VRFALQKKKTICLDKTTSYLKISTVSESTAFSFNHLFITDYYRSILSACLFFCRKEYMKEQDGSAEKL